MLFADWCMVCWCLVLVVCCILFNIRCVVFGARVCHEALLHVCLWFACGLLYVVRFLLWHVVCDLLLLGFVVVIGLLSLFLFRVFVSCMLLVFVVCSLCLRCVWFGVGAILLCVFVRCVLFVACCSLFAFCVAC